jgi:hypothetical protein
LPLLCLLGDLDRHTDFPPIDLALGDLPGPASWFHLHMYANKSFQGFYHY